MGTACSTDTVVDETKLVTNVEIDVQEDKQTNEKNSREGENKIYEINPKKSGQ